MSSIYKVPEYNITIHAGTDYALNLLFVEDNDDEITHYGSLVSNEVLYDTSDSSVSGEIMMASSYWSYDAETMEYTGSTDSSDFLDLNMYAHLREFPEAEDYYEFNVSVSSSGYTFRLNHDETSSIPYSKGYYDIFIEDPDDETRTKLLCGQAFIIPNVTR